MMFRLDKEIPADVLAVANAAALLDITEFELFRLAHLDWFGRAVSDKTIEGYFIPYMFRGVVPFWVRNFTRLIVRLDGAGDLDRERLGVPRRAWSRAMARRGTIYLLLIALALVVLYVAANDPAVLAKLPKGCMLPPCY
jgi:hypothetical protein